MNSPPEKSYWYEWYVVGVLMVAYMVAFVDRQVITLLVEPIRADLEISDTGISLLMGLAFAIFYVTMGVPIARLSDRYSRKHIISAGIFLWSLATAACGLARSFGQLFLARVGVGVGEATLTPAAYSIIADYFPPKKQGRAIAVYSMGIYLGAGLAMVAGGAVVRLITNADPIQLPVVGVLAPWQMTFVLVGLPGLALTAIMLLTVREPTRRDLLPTDAAAVPIRDIAAFMVKNRGTFASVFLGYSAGGMAFYGFLFWVPEFIRRTYGWDISDAGIVFGIELAVLGSLGAYCGGWICDWLTNRGVRDAALRAASVFLGISMPVMAVTPLMPSADLAIPMLGLMAFVMSMQQALSPVALQLVTPNQMRAQIMALFFLVASFCSIAMGATVVALLTDYVFRDDGDLRYSLSLVALVMMSLSTLSLALGLKPYRASLDRSLAWRDGEE
ncbi:spinster family MFS transporter [Lentisalinibacter orientalis]|uniref:spinster family MFS transporter n=1 Tax=Lentisalinibacter orientalis TaxID=2992241 RepID=UPI00386C5B82